MVGSDQEQVPPAQLLQQRSQQGIELFQRAGKAFEIFAMAIQHVKIHQVSEDQASHARGKGLLELRHAVCVALGSDIVLHAAAVVDVMNLSHSENGDATL